MKSTNDSQPGDGELDQYLQLKNLLNKCQNIINPEDFSIDEYNQYTLEFRRYKNFLRQINFSKSLGDQKNVLVNLENIRINLNHFLKKTGNGQLVTDKDTNDFSSRIIEVPILMERLQSLNDDQKQNEEQLNDISKGFEDVNKYMNSLKQKRKKTASKKSNVLPLHSFNISNLDKSNEDIIQDPRLQQSQFQDKILDDDEEDIEAERKSIFQFDEEQEKESKQAYLLNEDRQNLKNSSIQDLSQQQQSQQFDFENSQYSQQDNLEQDINGSPSIQLNDNQQEGSETYQSIQDDECCFQVSEDNIIQEAKLKMLKQKEKELKKYLNQIKNREFDGLYSFEKCRNLKNQKQLDKNYKIKLLSDLSYQIELRERKTDNKLKVNNKFHVEKHEIDEDGILRLITIVQEQIMQKRSELTKAREKTEQIYDEKNLLNEFFEQKKLDVIKDKKVQILKDQNREYYDRAQIFIDEKNKLEIENAKLKHVLQQLKQKIKFLNKQQKI